MRVSVELTSNSPLFPGCTSTEKPEWLANVSSISSTIAKASLRVWPCVMASRIGISASQNLPSLYNFP